jgi:anti-sigma regulatory factor (Ser/Thr protein kinase)
VVIVSATTAEAPFCEVPVRGDARALRLVHGPYGVPAARRALTEDLLTRLGQSPLVHEAAVVASELLGNAVRHADSLGDGGVLLRWQVRGDVVDIEVTDGGSAGRVIVRPLRPAAMAAHGRGLRIVRSLAHEWGVVDHEDGGRTVWAALGGPSRRRRPSA